MWLTKIVTQPSVLLRCRSCFSELEEWVFVLRVRLLEEIGVEAVRINEAQEETKSNQMSSLHCDIHCDICWRSLRQKRRNDGTDGEETSLYEEI